MIQKRFRLNKIEVEHLLKKGNSFRNPLFIIRYRKTLFPFSRFTIIISKKLEATAVKRNKLRRQIYEAIRKNTQESDQYHFDIALIPTKQVLSCSYGDKENAIISILSLQNTTWAKKS